MTIKNVCGEKFNIIPSTYKENENTYKLNSVFAAGMCYYFSEWLNDHGIADNTTEDVFNNTSGLRAVYDAMEDRYIGDIEIKA